MAGPNFICVGMPKAGTSWLYDQLFAHPDFWMPTIKDWPYLKRAEPRMGKVIRNRLERLKDPKLGPRTLAKFSNRRPGDSRDIEFLEEAASTTGIASYIALFRHKEGKLSGDITPGYSALTPEQIQQIAGALPDTKVILLVRDPISRAWSHTCMWHRGGRLPEGALESAEAYRAFLERSGSLGGEHFPTHIVNLWKQHAPDVSFRSFLFDDIVREPERTRAEILHHVGADPAKSSGKMPAGHNAKADREKLELTEALQGMLVEFFRDELLACAEVFGGAAREWPKKYEL